MASLIKRENSPFWIAAFDVVLADGSVRRLKKSTKKRKRSEAMVEAIRLEDLERKRHQAEVNGADKAYAVLAEAADAAAKGELSEGRAREMLARITEASTGEKLRFYTVRSWADDYLAMKASRGKPSTMSRYRTNLTAFLNWLGEKADGRLESITKADARRFRDQIRMGWPKLPRKTKDVSPPARTAKTTNHYAADVAGMFRAAVREGLLLASPFAALEKLPEDDSAQREIFTVAEVAKLVTAAGDPAWQDELFSRRRSTDESRAAKCRDWQGIILVGFYVGARLGDCARLKWSDIDLERKAVTFLPAKTERKRRRLEVPLHPRLLSFLDEREERRDGPLFPTQYPVKARGNQGLSAQFIAIMKHADVDRRELRAATDGRRAQFARSFHSLRHSLTSNLANLDVSEEIRRRIVGHDSPEVHAKYTHTERETLARALEKLPSI